ncbi:hypothetical protein C8Q77DRAFT_130171 [Trametes polyzona]|nr:hypothetical protein C8Q77DRAFT_130171 [Trametes polyzona]
MRKTSPNRKSECSGARAGRSRHSPDAAQVNWDESVVVYGIVGFLELYSASYLLVISSRNEVGKFLDPRHTVYSVKGVNGHTPGGGKSPHRTRRSSGS